MFIFAPQNSVFKANNRQVGQTTKLNFGYKQEIKYFGLQKCRVEMSRTQL